MEDNNIKNNNSEDNEKTTKRFNIIYVYQISDPSHNGILKIGKTSFKMDDIGNYEIKDIENNAPLLESYARKRIDQQTKTAGTHYDVIYCTLGIKNDGTSFDDNTVNEWLEKRGYNNEIVNGGTEWHSLSANQARRAIEAVKKNIDYADIDSSIQLLPLQAHAIDKTFSWFNSENRFYWICEKEEVAIVPSLFLIKKSQKQPDSIFNHVLIIGNSLEIGKDWSQNFNEINLSNCQYYFYQKDTSLGGSPFKKDEKINENNKFICFLNLKDFHEYEDIIRIMHWDLIIINEIDANIRTDIENKISQSSPNTKWLYFSKQNPDFSLNDNQNKKENQQNDSSNIIQTSNTINEINQSQVSTEETICLASSENELDLTWAKPVELIINNQKYQCHSWKDVLAELSNYLYKKFDLKFINIIDPDDVTDGSDNKHLRAPRQILNSKYSIETNFSANMCYSICRDFLEKLGIPLESVKIIIRRNKN